MATTDRSENHSTRINHGEGLTSTEKLLKYLGERSFLRFWSHANPHWASGKELCDLLVICGEYVFVFSDKNVGFQLHRGEQVAWESWYREAVARQANGLKGAVRRLINLRVPVYKDNRCTVPIGIPVPSSDQTRTYRIAVASLESDPDDSQPPTNLLAHDGALVGSQHVTPGATPFRLGDVSPESEFVHVMDVAGLSAVLTSLDTVSDFASYLDARCEFLRGKEGNIAENEWCMLTRYLLSFTEDGDRLPLDAATPGFTHLSNGEWRAESTKAALRARKEANDVSYELDYLIERQARRIETQSFKYSTYWNVEEAERVLRHLALESRLNRRVLAERWREVCLGTSDIIRTGLTA